ncbi:GCN5-related N-acetyltransferase [Anaeromyxobacter dehalogenans 2CP-1]|uniref:GCN5-related N-acetyltransferase n=1 Tax=Anaeromyxobacter dehalogenans (strain ATCC BAA-258 / DSM 21875 / 2CP-1) TaxID=455488 RepID=B8JBR6_ANAD2|nr:GNAT family N-acetyltransferase [Anaeromyxobacter dehalogenans]ACL67674.1 GCN5-related N-acetyltransferase [Anaeromyxobacter dehalogenans 2CP-1]
MPISVVPADTEPLRRLALALRDEVFVAEQGVPIELEHDAEDATAFHVVALDGGRCVGTGRLVRQAGGVGRVGRMAVARDRRRDGVGALLLQALEAQARAEGLAEIELHAQRYVEAFYRRHGYVPEGAPFLEAGIEHVVMRKRL